MTDPIGAMLIGWHLLRQGTRVPRVLQKPVLLQTASEPLSRAPGFAGPRDGCRTWNLPGGAARRGTDRCGRATRDTVRTVLEAVAGAEEGGKSTQPSSLRIGRSPEKPLQCRHAARRYNESPRAQGLRPEELFWQRKGVAVPANSTLHLQDSKTVSSCCTMAWRAVSHAVK